MDIKTTKDGFQQVETLDWDVWTILRNEEEDCRWCKVGGIAKKYPCFGAWRIDASEYVQASYLYLEDLEGMSRILKYNETGMEAQDGK